MRGGTKTVSVVCFCVSEIRKTFDASSVSGASAGLGPAGSLLRRRGWERQFASPANISPAHQGGLDTAVARPMQTQERCTCAFAWLWGRRRMFVARGGETLRRVTNPAGCRGIRRSWCGDSRRCESRPRSIAPQCAGSAGGWRLRRNDPGRARVAACPSQTGSPSAAVLLAG